MKLRTALTFARAAIRSVQYLLTDRVQFPRDRLGDVLEMPDGDAFVVYRETTLEGSDESSGNGAILVFEVEVTNRTKGAALREVLFDPFANVATPFFVGMPGFRRKLWLAGERPGEFLELYEWESAENAELFAAVLGSLLEPFAFAGRASFDVVADGSVDDYLAARSATWRDEDEAEAEDDKEKDRASPWRSVAFSLLFLAAIVVVAYLATKRGTAAE